MNSRGVLVTGAGGFIGSHVVARYSSAAEIVFSSVGQGRQRIAIDLDTPGAMAALIDEIRPRLVVHLAAISDIAGCKADPDRARRVNTLASIEIAESCARTDAKLVHVSTDQIFDGTDAPYSENDTPTPVHVYGRSKLEAESGVLAALPEALVIRPAIVFGPSPSGTRSASESVIQALRMGQRASLFNDEFRTPIAVDRLIDGMWALEARRAAGIVHLGGGERLSRYAFGCRIAEALDLDVGLIDSVSRLAIPGGDSRPADLTLESKLAEVTAGFVSELTVPALKRLHQN